MKALSIYAHVPDVASCLAPAIQDGKRLNHCLSDIFDKICITAVPDVCVRLEANVSPEPCLEALVPFLSEDVLGCVYPRTVTSSIGECLSDVLDLESYDTHGPLCPLEPTKKACLKVPGICTKLEGLMWLRDDPELEITAAHCKDALAAADISDIAVGCLAELPRGGSQIVSCLRSKIEGQCLRKLPRECGKLAGLHGHRLSDRTPDCKAALGPFLTSSAQQCLSSQFLDGRDLVNCLVGALFT